MDKKLPTDKIGYFDPEQDDFSAPLVPSGAELLDPKLMQRAVKRMQACLRGNGVDISQIKVIDCSDIKTFRFPAWVQIKLVPQYGIRTEAGKNTRAELAVSQEDFQRKIDGAVHDAVTIPDKRQSIIEYVFQKSEKGFGIKRQAVKLRTLTKDLVQHEQCVTCSRSGYVPCPRCQGRQVDTCPNCRGSHMMLCQKCGGSGRMQTPNGPASCDFCRGQARVSCTMCGASGQIKCPGCAARGKIACQKCSGTGWLSHLAHIEFQAQIHFDFERSGLPARLSALVEDRAGLLATRGDLEVSLQKPGEGKDDGEYRFSSVRQKEELGKEYEDSIMLYYEASCPYGAMHFDVETREIPTLLFGWQARLIESPSFLEDYTRQGMEALREASRGQGSVHVVSLLRRAVRFSIWKELISQVLQSGNLRRVSQTMLNRYNVGLSRDGLVEMVRCADRAVRSVTRLPRYAGLSVGLILFSGLVYWLDVNGLRGEICSSLGVDVRSNISFILEICLFGLGVLLSLLLGQSAAMIAQKKAFSGIVPDEILGRRIPRIGAAALWAVSGSALITIGGLFLAAYLGIRDDLPDLIIRLMPT